MPGVDLKELGGALLVAAVIAVVNALLPPLVASLRLPFMLVLGFVSVLLIDAAALLIADDVFPDVIAVGSFGDALLASLVMAAVSIVLEVLTGTNEDDEYTLRVVKRIARRQGGRPRPRSRGRSASRSTGSRCRCSGGRCATAAPRTSPAGSPRTATTLPSGRPTSPRRPAPARRGSCSVRTRTSRRSAGSRRRPRR